MDSHHSTRPGWARRFAALAGAAMLPTVVACAPPGSGNTVTAPTDPIPVNIDLGTDPIELTLYDGAGLKKIDEAMIAAFTARHPNVTITARYDPDEVQAVNAPRVLASENPPDIARIIALPAAVANHQLTELDSWADAYGWNELPEEQMAMYRVGANGVRGTGPQYTMASGFTLTGLYYNKDLATRIGMTSPPTTVEQFEQALASAKTAGLIPVMAGNKSAQVTFLVQMMLNSALGQDTIIDWVFNAPGATLDTPPGSTRLRSWPIGRRRATSPATPTAPTPPPPPDGSPPVKHCSTSPGTGMPRPCRRRWARTLASPSHPRLPGHQSLPCPTRCRTSRFPLGRTTRMLQRPS